MWDRGRRLQSPRSRYRVQVSSARRTAAGLVVAVLLGPACVSPAATRPQTTAAALPPGFTRYHASKLGFDMGLAPGWRESAVDPASGASFSGPGGVSMLVHVEQAASTDLQVVSGALLFDLTNGSGAAGGRQDAVRLAGRPAERTSGRFIAAGVIEEIEAYVMLESGRAWAVALAGSPEQVDRVRTDFERMAATFQLTGTAAPPPSRLAVGLPAPAFPELSRISGPVVIDFFATWCPDCRMEMQLLAKRAVAGGRRFTLVGVDCCGDDAAAVPGFLDSLGVHRQYRVVASDRDGRIGQSYALLGPPTTAFLDRDHVLRRLEVGLLTPDRLEQGLRAAGAA
jgi:cytochrome c biogenesis protein CcmG/thiol:disulfide interchange protein DsbE